MQLLDDVLRPILEQDALSAWFASNIHPDTPRVEQSLGKLVRVRIELLGGNTLTIGGGAASRDVVMPHSYRITGTFPYPNGSEGSVNAAQVARWNALVALLTADYPCYAGWRYSEEVGWEFADNAEEETYDVSVLFTVLVIAPVRTG